MQIRNKTSLSLRGLLNIQAIQKEAAMLIRASSRSHSSFLALHEQVRMETVYSAAADSNCNLLLEMICAFWHTYLIWLAVGLSSAE